MTNNNQGAAVERISKHNTTDNEKLIEEAASAEGPAFIAMMPPSPETSKRWYSMYCRACGVEEMMADTADDPSLVARRDEHNLEGHSAPQGEASEAQIDAMQEILYDDAREGDRDVIRRAWRAALRAAGGVR